MSGSINAPQPGPTCTSPAARLATSAETCERGEAVGTYAQAIVQLRRSLGDRLLSQIDESKPVAKGSGSGRISGTSGATRSDLARAASRPFYRASAGSTRSVRLLGQGSVTISARVR
jgi:hypothetical protein